MIPPGLNSVLIQSLWLLLRIDGLGQGSSVSSSGIVKKEKNSVYTVKVEEPGFAAEWEVNCKKKRSVKNSRFFT